MSQQEGRNITQGQPKFVSNSKHKLVEGKKKKRQQIIGMDYKRP
jgi:hypothetical protein